ncbi:hypothetical protein [Edaphobacter modestus]|uniref:Lipocalin-like protein n=1 Tax=Edaphobacter modestus TaxID=388466 RepID=A0A4Q7YSN0_9BACT|nr:hypothetical protein [Edaphobacter modestus]RZU40244.1 hypothetical protein BDD14_1689 [Edaphobacter modestus]
MRLCRDFMIVPLFLCAVGGFAIGGGVQAAANDSAKSAASSDQQARFTGTYRYAGSAQGEEARRAAIDHAVEGFSFVTRSTARNRVSATTQILGFYSFSFEPGKIVVRPEARPEMVSGDKGEPVDYVYNGKHSTLTQVLAADRISQVFVSDDGRRENEYTLSKDGKTVTLKVTLTSGRLSSPVAYSLSYKKAD